MVSTNVSETPVYGLRFSSVVPAQVTGDLVHELTNMDLAMKLHYLRGVYFFKSNAVQGLTTHNFKEPMFKWLELYYQISGRIRRSETGRPFVKCNDGGVRIIEAKCNVSIEEWLEMEDESDLNKSLVSGQVLGFDLAYSPLVLIQFTSFKCGGISVGLSWAHVLGDAFSATKFINLWSQILAGVQPPKSLNLSAQPTTEESKILVTSPLSLKQVKHAGDHWKFTNTCKMRSFTFQITAKQLNNLHSSKQIPTFEALSSVIWQSVAKIREGSEPRMVTVVKNGSGSGENWVLSNNQIVSVVRADFSIVEADPSKLAELINKEAVDEKIQIEEIVEKKERVSDVILYGGNLTFVDLQDVELYGLKIQGYKPVFANYTIDSIGDEGVVIVLPGQEEAEEKGARGKTVTVIVPENEVSALKCELRKNGAMPEKIIYN
ncbi:hypothetical protein GIB67_029713 [Kingdonia uniflora]|uniref:Uncharacterized protein n=1 Tax=Kingdonia uniflora TaxID=39325 RepID=A0A7J7LM28_9MAGN|nr:hypothetical protein GIB67_029713 [Kingdonia uniflora]